MDIITREQYMARTAGADDAAQFAAHRAFYGQLVTPRTIAAVAAAIGPDRLMASTDRYFNDIEMVEWDAVTGYYASFLGSTRTRELKARPTIVIAFGGFERVGDYPTRAGLVAVAKEAARQYVELVRSAE